ncbi:C-C motif chemokine 4 homolog [Coregonus clupeaformis]|uniref:C-C motif chemokine 4 homolog n=1 Tax=Coregonus clupeaformis TaxID=59861 RepID=UPI001E1C2AB1|nr:C-C motif chemokine 4 homolog [Coregonus clupeaformis]
MRSAQILLLLCILGAALWSAALANNGNGPEECCFKYYTRKLPGQLIREYEMTRSDCPKRGVILVTRKSYRLCANPDDPSIENIMKSIDDRKFQ